MTVAVYLIALAGYTWLGGMFISGWAFLHMDSGLGWSGWIGIAVILALWITGLCFGTAAYF
jgi:hypothetical protein